MAASDNAERVWEIVRAATVRGCIADGDLDDFGPLSGRTSLRQPATTFPA